METWIVIDSSWVFNAVIYLLGILDVRRLARIQLGGNPPP